MQTPACYATGKTATTRKAHSSIGTKMKFKNYFLRIIKITLLYHLKQTSWQSMNKWSFRTSKFTLMPSGLNFYKSTNTLKSDFSRTKKEKIRKHFLGKNGNSLFFNLKKSLNSDEKWPNYKSLYLEVTSSWSTTTTTIKGYS